MIKHQSKHIRTKRKQGVGQIATATNVEKKQKEREKTIEEKKWEQTLKLAENTK